MSCPPDIAEIIVDIIQTGLLRIRGAAWANQTERCAIEADHVHNLPTLLVNYSPGQLKYYWEVERPSFIKETSPAEQAAFAPLWTKLAGFIPAQTDPVAVP